MRKQINILKDVVRNPYAWPGGYEKVLCMNDGGAICSDCAKSEFYGILHSTKFEYNDGWQVAEVFTTAECENHERCDHCNKYLDAYNEEQ